MKGELYLENASFLHTTQYCADSNQLCVDVIVWLTISHWRQHMIEYCLHSTEWCAKSSESLATSSHYFQNTPNLYFFI